MQQKRAAAGNPKIGRGSERRARLLQVNRESPMQANQRVSAPRRGLLAVKLLTYKERVEALRVTDRRPMATAPKLMGRDAGPHLQLVAVEGLSADPERDPRPRPRGH